jgi:enoyl-CoA hydratase
MISLELRDSIAIVCLNRPEKLNALAGEMLSAIGETFKRIKSEGQARAVVLTGAGDRAFSAGTDIHELSGINAEEAVRVSRRGQAVCDLIEGCNVPVIAAVNGIAVGGGCELALACHIRIASISASFSLPEVKLGMIPAYGGTQRLARVIGNGRALEMMLTGASVSAEEALRINLVNRVVEGAQLLSESLALAGEIATLAPLAISACLEAVTRGQTLPLEEGLKLEAELFSRLFNTEDVREGTLAFLEKRAPVFKGK